MNLSKFAFKNEVYDHRSWIADCVVVRKSDIHGHGVFTEGLIAQGQLVVELRGVVFTMEDVKAGHARQDSVTGIEEGFYLGQPPLTDNQIVPTEEFLNHSCDPTLWLNGRTKLIARRQISPGEELTVDYSTWEIDNEWSLEKNCNCNSPHCRQNVTGRDWTSRSFQERYAGHLLPCLAIRILNVTRAAVR
jgi:SET domain-containing protein